LLPDAASVYVEVKLNKERGKKAPDAFFPLSLF
jgi:hypothetical protein